MKKIGIITYHFAQNYGSVLQCYALQEYLKSKKYDVSIINFVSDVQKQNNSFARGLKGKIKSIIFFPLRRERMNKLNKFIDFRNKNLNETYHVSNLYDLKELIINQSYDIIISGSDQVFNPNINDYNEAFVFPFKTKAIKIAYAASLGNAKENELNKIREYLLDFRKISLREKTDKKIFENVTNIKTTITCDPVFLLTKKEWQDRIDHINIEYDISKKYLLCYFIHKNYMSKAIKIARQIAKARNLKLICINAGYDLHSFSNETIVGCGPNDFLKLFALADFICTDSFHGTSFSIILNKDFLCIDTKNNKKDNRRKDLLEKMGLLSRLQYVEDDIIKNNISGYAKVNKTIDTYSSESKKFLEL